MSSTSGTMRDTVRDTMKDAKDAARESSRAASAASGDIQADLEALRNDVARLGSQLADIFASRGNAAWSRARSNIEGVVSDASTKGQDAVNAVREYSDLDPALAERRAPEPSAAVREVGDNMVDAIDESLKKRPYTTLALAVGIGFLFGATWRR